MGFLVVSLQWSSRRTEASLAVRRAERYPQTAVFREKGLSQTDDADDDDDSPAKGAPFATEPSRKVPP